MKIKSKFRFLSGILVILIALLLIFAGQTGAYILLGFGIGQMISAFSSQEKMAQGVENALHNADIIFFRIFELGSICLIFREGYEVIGFFALLSLILVELWCRKRNKQ